MRKGTYYGGIDRWEKEKIANMGMYYALKIVHDML